MPETSNTQIAFEAGEQYAIEVDAGLSTASATIACPYDSEEMQRAFEQGFNHFFDNKQMDCLEDLRFEAASEYDRAHSDDPELNREDPDFDDWGFTYENERMS